MQALRSALAGETALELSVLSHLADHGGGTSDVIIASPVQEHAVNRGTGGSRVHQMPIRRPRDWMTSVAIALCDTLTAYLTLQAREGLSPAYSEYLLYDPIVRVARYRGLVIRSEVGLQKMNPGRGDLERIDFAFQASHRSRATLFVEVKYVPRLRTWIDITNDVRKLQRVLEDAPPRSRAFVILAGRKRRIGVSATPFGTRPTLGQIYDTTYPARHTNFGATVLAVERGTQASD